MASQVRPWLIEPKTLRGSEESVGMIRNQPAYSIRASDIESHTKAGCMAAINSCEPKQKKALGKKGRPCMKCHLCARKHTAPCSSAAGCIAYSAQSEPPSPGE